ncbi:MAG: hypothetical protein M9897_13990 [Brumimicrobium sp.]|nr:hypothetical protein [Brumimicrobium sp.]
MLKKILFQHKNQSQLYIAILGTLLGFIFLVTSIHYFIQIQHYGESSEMVGDNTYIIQKKVTDLSMLQLSQNIYNQEDIEDIKKQTFTQEIKPVKSNNFDITIQTDSEIVPYFRSDIFIQSVDYEFIQSNSLFWDWNVNSEYVPVVLPREFLVMLNTFASAKGLPQVSENLAKSIGFKFTLYDREHKEQFKVQIIGFTSKISSILVPPSFMEYGSKHFSSEISDKTTQIMVSVVDGEFGTFESYLTKHQMEASENAMTIGKFKSVAGVLFSILIGVGILTVLLSGLVILQYIQIIIFGNQYEIQTLLRIGYSPRQILNVFILFFIKINLLLMLISFLIFAALKYFIDQLLFKNGLFIDNGLTLTSVIALLLTTFFLILINYTSTRKSIYKFHT